MSFPPTNAMFPPTAFHPEPLLAVACPTCFGAIAVGTDLLGQAADCPLCGRGFRVPVAGVADAPRPSAWAAPAAVAPSTTPPARPRKHRGEAAPEPPPYEPVSQPAPEDPVAEPQPQAAPVAELQFQEPLRTVLSGDHVITLRRLTPEEKAVRRGRRNLIMMLTGVSILMAIVLLFGTKRPKRRG
jgi:hypothetical protein